MPWLRCLVVLLILGSAAPAADWPQWLGPDRDASSSEVVAVWKQAPKVLWRQPVGEAHSSPIVADGKVFLHTKVKNRDEEEVSAFDAQTGKPLWSGKYPRGELHKGFITIFGIGPRSTPIAEKGRLYTLGVTGMLICWDTAKGERLWMVDTKKDFSAPDLPFGVSCSPLIDGERLLINVGARGASVVAFDKNNGKVIWKSLDDRPSYSSPILFGEGKQRQVVFLTQQGLVSLDPENGKLFWKVPLEDRLNESSITPVKVGEYLLASSVTFGSLGVQLGNENGKPTGKQVWKNPVLTCYFSTPVPVGEEHVYLVAGTILPPSSTMRCIELKTGKELWNRPKVGKYHASLMRTGDKKLLMLDDSGNLILLEPSPKGYQELARSPVCGPTWAHPALSNGRLYLRDGKELICLQVGK